MLEKKSLDKNEKRIAGLFFDLDKMEKVLDEVMKNLEPEADRQNGNYKLDFSMTISQEGEILIEGNKKQKQVPFDFREPLVEIFDKPENTLITVEMPGVEEKNLEVKLAENNTIEITASGEKKFYKRINFQHPIKNQFGQKFKNGILELNVEKDKTSLAKP
jgi:HSP20 family molecular chaperone IbpA